jgi:hypothetical protein
VGIGAAIEIPTDEIMMQQQQESMSGTPTPGPNIPF